MIITPQQTVAILRFANVKTVKFFLYSYTHVHTYLHIQIIVHIFPYPCSLLVCNQFVTSIELYNSQSYIFKCLIAISHFVQTPREIVNLKSSVRYFALYCEITCVRDDVLDRVWTELLSFNCLTQGGLNCFKKNEIKDENGGDKKRNCQQQLYCKI